MRCPDCNKFVSMDLGDSPDMNIDVDAEGTINGDVTITRNCTECGTELKEGRFDINVMIPVNPHEQNLSPSMMLTLAVARINGCVFAGGGNQLRPGALISISVSSITGLVRRGLLTQQISPDGGLAARPVGPFAVHQSHVEEAWTMYRSSVAGAKR
jgi:hypothetical protein